MILIPGKFYTVRNPERSQIIKVRVDCIRPDDVKPSQRVAVSVFYNTPGCRPVSCDRWLGGSYYHETIESDWDLVEEYLEPHLIFTATDVGRVVEFNNGSTMLITAFHPGEDFPVETPDYLTDLTGKTGVVGPYIVRRFPN